MTFCKNLFKFLVLIALIATGFVCVEIKNDLDKEKCKQELELSEVKWGEMWLAHNTHFVTGSDHDFLEFRAKENEWHKAIAKEDHCHGTFVWLGHQEF